MTCNKNFFGFASLRLQHLDRLPAHQTNVESNEFASLMLCLLVDEMSSLVAHATLLEHNVSSTLYPVVAIAPPTLVRSSISLRSIRHARFSVMPGGISPIPQRSPGLLI